LFAQTGCQKERTALTEPETTPVRTEPVTAAPSAEEGEQPSQAPGTGTEKTKPVAPKAGARIKFEKVVHNFGEVGPASINVAEFNFTNTGSSLLKIGNIKSTCSCTVPKLAKKEYAPGESGTIKLVYRAGKHPASATRRVSVPSNDKAKPKIQLTVKARVAKKIDYKPNQIKLSLKRENASCPEITLTGLDNKPFAVKSFRSPGDCITASFDSSKTATKHVLQPKVNVEKLKENKNKRGSIRIGLTHPDLDMVTIKYQVQPEFKITPSSIYVRDARPQKPVKRDVMILNNFGGGFEVESTASKEGFIKVLSQEKAGTRCKFHLEITPPPSEDKRTFSDVFYVNIEDGEKLKINCRGAYANNKKRR
jgi:hypothetical protein